MSSNNQPVYIMPEDTKRTTGKDAQFNNIMAAKAVANTVRTTLGPKGMDKMLVDSAGEVIVTNDGVTILKEMQVEHPAAKMIIEIAKTQEDAVGDGTTTAVVLAGELLKKAESLLEQDIHPTILTKGFRLAEKKAQEYLRQVSTKIKINDKQLLEQIANTAMTGKGAEANKELLSKIIVEAVISICEIDEKIKVSRDDISVQRKVGSSTDKSELIKGIIIDREIIHPSMPKKVQNAKIALMDCSLEIKNTEVDAKIQITDPSQLQTFLDQEEKALRDMCDKIIGSGANVVFCQKGIDDLAAHFLAKAGIIATRRVRKSDLERLAKATNAKIISNWKEISQEQLGSCGEVNEERVGEDEMIFVKDCQNPKSVTILVTGGTEHIAKENKRAVTDAIGDVCSALVDGKFVCGAGAIEMNLSRKIRKYSAEFQGREQLAVLAFSEALEIVPRTLAENAGLDPIDTLTKLRSAHDINQDKQGIDVFTGELMDAGLQGVIEPLKIKTQAIASATEVSEMILRIDDVILAKKQEQRRDPTQCC